MRPVRRVQAGRRYGQLIAIERVVVEVWSRSPAHQQWLFRCRCGIEIVRPASVVTMPRAVPTCRVCAQARLRELTERRRRRNAC